MKARIFRSLASGLWQLAMPNARWQGKCGFKPMGEFDHQPIDNGYFFQFLMRLESVPAPHASPNGGRASRSPGNLNSRTWVPFSSASEM